MNYFLIKKFTDALPCSKSDKTGPVINVGLSTVN